MNKPIILATNVELLQKGQSAKDSEISVGILPSDINKDEPILYAYRQGMVYDPKNDFKPDVKNGHVLPDKLISAYYALLDEAKKNLDKFKKEFSSGGNSDEIKDLENRIERKSERLRSLGEQMQLMNDRINILKDENSALNEALKHAKKDDSGENSQVKKLEKMIETLAQMQNNRIEIKIGEKATKIIEKIVHEKFANILTLLSVDEAVYMYGKAGTGKSQIAEDIAKALELPFFPASTITQEFKLTGYMDANGIYRETNFYKAMKHGGVFFLDEMDSCASEVLVGINGALANGYFDFPHETVYAHENFRVIAAGNTIGRGGNMAYTGRQALDISTLDRFLAVEIGYSEAIDKAVAKNDMELVEFAHAVRKAADENEIIILMSYRSISKIVKLKDMFDLVEVLNMAFIKGMAKDDIRMLWRNMSIDSNNKYFKALKQAA